MKSRTVLLGLGLVGAMMIASRAQAQGPRTVKVAVALVDSLSAPGLKAEVLRFSDPAKPDVILLRSGVAGPADLAAAILSYRRSAASTPSRPGLVGRLTIAAHTADSPAANGLRVRAAEMLATVRRQPLGRVGNYGRGRWSTFEIRIDG